MLNFSSDFPVLLMWWEKLEGSDIILLKFWIAQGSLVNWWAGNKIEIKVENRKNVGECNSKSTNQWQPQFGVSFSFVCFYIYIVVHILQYNILVRNIGFAVSLGF